MGARFSACNGSRSIQDGEMNDRTQPTLSLVRQNLPEPRLAYNEENWNIVSIDRESNFHDDHLNDTAQRVDWPLPAYQSTETSFTCFTRLPFELRRKIWKLAFPDPRIFSHYRVPYLTTDTELVSTHGDHILPSIWSGWMDFLDCCSSSRRDWTLNLVKHPDDIYNSIQVLFKKLAMD